MNKTNKIWRILPVLFIGVYLNYNFVKGVDEEYILDNVFTGSLLLLFLIVLMITNIMDIREYKQAKTRLSFLPSAVGCLVIVSLITSDYILKSRDSSPLLIQAGYDGGYNGAWFEFREDGTYKFANSGGIGANFFRGTYQLSDSIILLDRSDMDKAIQSNLLIIREIKQSDSTTLNMLYQINEQHTIIDKEFAFTVNVDNRKK